MSCRGIPFTFKYYRGLSFEGEAEHEGAALEVVERADIDIGVFDLEVDKAEVHLELDGELDVAQKDVESHAHGVTQV